MYDYQFSDAALTTWVLLRQTWIAMYKVAKAKLARIGLTPEQFNVLWVSRDYPGPLSAAELSRLIFREPSTITGLLSRMERDGLVKRVLNRTGKPFVEVQITDKGKEAIAPGIVILKALMTAMTPLSPEEHTQLQRLLRVLQQAAGEQLHLDITPPPGYSPGEVIPVEW